MQHFKKHIETFLKSHMNIYQENFRRKNLILMEEILPSCHFLQAFFLLDMCSGIKNTASNKFPHCQSHICKLEMQNTCGKKWQNFAGRVPSLTPSSAFILAWDGQQRYPANLPRALLKCSGIHPSSNKGRWRRKKKKYKRPKFYK